MPASFQWSSSTIVPVRNFAFSDRSNTPQYMPTLPSKVFQG